jgi:hypothetical protein
MPRIACAEISSVHDCGSVLVYVSQAEAIVHVLSRSLLVMLCQRPFRSFLADSYRQGRLSL